MRYPQVILNDLLEEIIEKKLECLGDAKVMLKITLLKLICG
jgi:hypothetical protein